MHSFLLRFWDIALIEIFSAFVCTYVSSFAIRPTREDVNNCEKVFCELFVTAPFAFVCLIKKDEARTGSVDDPLDNLHAESRESVSVGHHNLVDHSFLTVFQKPLEAFAFVVEPRGNVFVDFEVRVRFLHSFDLTLEVFLLFGR
jgi:hypothetical protein